MNIIILSAGKGTRMKSSLPKTLHKLVGRTMLDMVCDLGLLVGKNVIAVISPEMENLITKKENIKYVVQSDRLGTGHATQVSLKEIDESLEKTIILYGDTPLLSKQIIENQLAKLNECDLVVGAFEVSDINQKYGRLITNCDVVDKIIEYKNATEETREIKLCNSGIYAIKTSVLLRIINQIQKNELSGEYYLTDLIELCHKNNFCCKYIECAEDDLLGVNSQQDLWIANNKYQHQLRIKHLENGVLMADPGSVYFYDDTKIKAGTEIAQGVIFGEKVEIGSNCKIGIYTYIANSSIADNTNIQGFSHIEGCKTQERVIIGPFARIRPNTEIKKGAKVGNFVEIKASILAENSKANHLSYIGNAEIGANTNFGAGSITCNYDGFNKHKTQIGQNCLIGANTSLIAPIKIGSGAVIGAGSVITKNVLDGDLSVARSEQKNFFKKGERYKNKKNAN